MANLQLLRQVQTMHEPEVDNYQGETDNTVT